MVALEELAVTLTGLNSEMAYEFKVCAVNDVIEMILDLNKLELKYMVNEIDFGVFFDKSMLEQTSYRAMVSVWGVGSVIKLLCYECQ